MRDKKLYWMPVGGNNAFHALGGNANILSVTNETNFDPFENAILIDFGNLPVHGFKDFNYIIPDLDHLFPPLKSNEEPKVKALILTHYHDDHMKGVVDLIVRGRKLPPIIAPPMVFKMLDLDIQKYGGSSNSYQKIVALPKQEIKRDDWCFTPFSVSHSTAGCLGFSIKTHGYHAVHMGDFKNDQNVFLGPKTDLDYLALLGTKGGIDALIIDSTKALNDRNLFVDDLAMQDHIDHLFNRHPSQRIVVGLYGAYLELLSMVAIAAAKKGRKIVLASRYIDENFHAYEECYGSLAIKMSKHLGIPVEIYLDTDPRVQNFKREELCIITDGNVRDYRSLINAYNHGEKRPYLNLEKGDALYLSRAVLKGKKEEMDNVLRRLAHDGVEIFTADQTSMTSHGHGPWYDIKKIVELTKPKFVLPAYAMDFMLTETFNKVSQMQDNIKACVVDNGDMVQIAPLPNNEQMQPIFSFMPQWIGTKYNVYKEPDTWKSGVKIHKKNPLKP